MLDDPQLEPDAVPEPVDIAAGHPADCKCVVCVRRQLD